MGGRNANSPTNVKPYSLGKNQLPSLYESHNRNTDLIDTNLNIM